MRNVRGLHRTSEKIRYIFTVEKYQYYAHMICIEFTACDKINSKNCVALTLRLLIMSAVTVASASPFKMSLLQTVWTQIRLLLLSVCQNYSLK